MNRFCAQEVNLDPAITHKARRDLDALVDCIYELPASDTDFPSLDPDFSRIQFGSFARRTQVQPLDDIDLMIVLDPQKVQCEIGFFGGRPKLKVFRGTRLEAFLHPRTRHLNSRLVINQFIRSLRAVPKFQSAEILQRNGAAAVLQLQDQDWTYDIVPAIHVKGDFFTPNRFLIPDGHGHWQYTDPRIDQERATTINQRHHGQVLQMVRLVKYWNREHGPEINSYLLETLVLNWYKKRRPDRDAFRCGVLARLLQHVSKRMGEPIRDPKGIQGDLNLMGRDQRRNFRLRARQHGTLLEQGILHARHGDLPAAIQRFQTVLGPEFGP